MQAAETSEQKLLKMSKEWTAVMKTGREPPGDVDEAIQEVQDHETDLTRLQTMMDIARSAPTV